MKRNLFKSDNKNENTNINSNINSNRFNVLKEDIEPVKIQRVEEKVERRVEERRVEPRVTEQRIFFRSENKEKKSITPIFDETNFPTLLMSNNNNNNSSNKVKETNTNYSNIVKIEKPIQKIIDNNICKPGWIQIKMIDGNVIYRSVDKLNKDEYDLNNQMNNAIYLMKENWDNYKETYIYLYGIDEYNRNYTMPINNNNDDDNNDDYESDEIYSLSDSDLEYFDIEY